MGRKALRRRRKPRRSRRRHPQRTLRIRHGFASFGRYYFAPEKKINTKKVWILSGDKSFSVWKGAAAGEMAGVMQSRCAPRRRAARGPGWGGGAVIRLDPLPSTPGRPGHLQLPVSLFPRTLQYWDLVHISFSVTTEGSCSPGIATSHEFFSRGRFGAQLASALLVATSG